MISVRDPADWLWAAYNFWTFPFDPDYRPGVWTSEKSLRSPGHFHGVVTNPSSGFSSLYPGGPRCKPEWVRPCKPWLKVKAATMHSMLAKFGGENCLFVRSEDFSDMDVMRRIFAFMELDIGLASEELMTTRTNSDATFKSRGIRNRAAANTSADGLYEVSGFLPMLPQTRKFIYQYPLVRSYCLDLYNNFSLEYPTCLAGVELANSSGVSGRALEMKAIAAPSAAPEIATPSAAPESTTPSAAPESAVASGFDFAGLAVSQQPSAAGSMPRSIALVTLILGCAIGASAQWLHSKWSQKDPSLAARDHRAVPHGSVDILGVEAGALSEGEDGDL